MTFKKGQSGNPNGRVKGSVNRTTKEFKQHLNNLLETAAPDMVQWLKEIEDPRERFQVLKDFAEYIHPKLSRSESKITLNEQDEFVKQEAERLYAYTTEQETLQ